MIKIFLAHAKEDKKVVRLLYYRLRDCGFDPWLDEESLLPGQYWKSEIPKAIWSSDIFIACLSRRSIEKKSYVQKEFRMALNVWASRPANEVYLIPLRLDRCTIPDLRREEYGINLRDVQWVDLFQTDGFERLLKGIQFKHPSVDPLRGLQQSGSHDYKFYSETPQQSSTEFFGSSNAEDTCVYEQHNSERRKRIDRTQIRGIRVERSAYLWIGVSCIVLALLYSFRASAPTVIRPDYIEKRGEESSIYVNKHHLIEATYPKTWIIRRLHDEDDLTIHDPIAKEIVEFYPPNFSIDAASPRIVIKASEISEEVSLDEYTDFSVENILETIPDAQIIESKPIEIAGYSAHKLIYEGTPLDTQLRVLSAWSIQGNRLYQITYSAQSDEYEEFEDVVEHMIDSFKIIEI